MLLDAKEKQMQNRGLTVWLDHLKVVFHDAMDVLDEFECEDLRRKVVETYGNTSEQVLHSVLHSSFNPLGFRFKIFERYGLRAEQDNPRTPTKRQDARPRACVPDLWGARLHT